MNKNYYQILGVLDAAEDIVIKASYRALAQRYHPDKWTGDKDEATRRMAEINEAYSVLSDPEKRKRYDEQRCNDDDDDDDDYNDDNVDEPDESDADQEEIFEGALDSDTREFVEDYVSRFDRGIFKESQICVIATLVIAKLGGTVTRARYFVGKDQFITTFGGKGFRKHSQPEFPAHVREVASSRLTLDSAKRDFYRDLHRKSS